MIYYLQSEIKLLKKISHDLNCSNKQMIKKENLNNHGSKKIVKINFYKSKQLRLI